MGMVPSRTNGHQVASAGAGPACIGAYTPCDRTRRWPPMGPMAEAPLADAQDPPHTLGQRLCRIRAERFEDETLAKAALLRQQLRKQRRGNAARCAEQLRVKSAKAQNEEITKGWCG
jgi:hypothetical protein